MTRIPSLNISTKQGSGTKSKSTILTECYQKLEKRSPVTALEFILAIADKARSNDYQIGDWKQVLTQFDIGLDGSYPTECEVI